MKLVKAKTWSKVLPKFPFLKAVVVDWEDACSTIGWDDLSNLQQHKTVSIRSVGYLLKNTKKELTLVGTLASDGSASQGLTIPKDWVQRVRVIPTPPGFWGK